MSSLTCMQATFTARMQCLYKMTNLMGYPKLWVEMTITYFEYFQKSNPVPIPSAKACASTMALRDSEAMSSALSETSESASLIITHSASKWMAGTYNYFYRGTTMYMTHVNQETSTWVSGERWNSFPVSSTLAVAPI